MWEAILLGQFFAGSTPTNNPTSPVGNMQNPTQTGSIFNMTGQIGQLFSNTIGNVLANGFNFSCWNVAITPSQAVTWCETQLQPWFSSKVAQLQQIAGSTQLSEVFSELSKKLSAIKEYALFHKSESNASCSKDANQIKADVAGGLDAQLIQFANQNYSQDFNISTSSVSINAVEHTPSSELTSLSNWKGKTNRPTTARQFTFTAKSVTSGLIGQGSALQSIASIGILPLLLIGTLIYQGVKYFSKPSNKYKTKFKKRT